MSVLNIMPAVPGRKVDLLAFHTDTPFSMTEVRQTLLTGSGGAACMGLQKLAQQVMIRIYTKFGGKIYDDTQGGQFVGEILSGAIRTVADARRSFSYTKDRVLVQFEADYVADSTIPLDEQLADIELTGATIAGDVLSLSITISSRAGTSGTFIAPITVA